MKAKQVTLTQPIDWIAAFKSQAEAEGYTLSEWIGKQGFDALSPDVQANLGPRDKPGPKLKADK